MSKKIILILVAIGLIAGAVFVIKGKEAKLANLPKAAQTAPTVQVATVAKGSLEAVSHYLATIEPMVKSDLSPRISGNILSITKREGDTVRQGELLATIDDRELQDRAVAVNADLLATRQRLAGAESLYMTQKSVFKRDEALYKGGAISQEALERSKALLESAKATVDAYNESLNGLAMNTNVAKTQAGYARIIAPFNGVVSKRWSEPGDLAAPGKPVLTLEKIVGYKILAQVPQEELSGISSGTPVRLTNGGEVLPVKVNRIYPALGKNMLATVEVLTQGSPFKLPSSSTVGFDVVTKKVEGLTLPEQGIVKSAQGAFVYTVKDGAIHIKPVKLLASSAGKAVISGEVEAGAQVAIGQENKLLTLAEGVKVSVVEPAGKTSATSEPKGAANPTPQKTGGKP